MSDGAADTRRHAAQGNVVSQKRLSGCAQGLTDGLQAPAVMSRCALERQGLGSLPLFYFPPHKIPGLLLLRHTCSSEPETAAPAWTLGQQLPGGRFSPRSHLM